MAEPHNVADYYDQTQNHFEIWWKFNIAKSLHYGIWEKDTKNLQEALENTNRSLLDIAQINSNDKVLDAGCGVGGATVFIAKETQATVHGISLSQKQVDYATKYAKEQQVGHLVDFSKQDYSKTSFPDSWFNVVWACESVSSSKDLNAFCKEAHRLLEPEGRLVLCDFFITSDDQADPGDLIRKWGDTWAITRIFSSNELTNKLAESGFHSIETWDVTDKIKKSADRIYWSYFLGRLGSKMYNFFHKNVSRYAKNHYLSGYYQQKALKQGLWRYKIIYAKK